jgi:hypothetical protein
MTSPTSSPTFGRLEPLVLRAGWKSLCKRWRMIIQMGKEEIRRRAFDDFVPAWTRRGKKNDGLYEDYNTM